MAGFINSIVKFSHSRGFRLIYSPKWAKRVALRCVFVDNGFSDHTVSDDPETG